MIEKLESNSWRMKYKKYVCVCVCKWKQKSWQEFVFSQK